MAGNNWPSTSCSCKAFQSLSRGIRLYAFSRSTKHAKRSLPYSQNYSKICFRIKIWSVVLRPGQKPHWPSSSFDSTISRHFLSRHLAYTFPGKLMSDIPLYFVHFLRSPFLNIGIIIPVCQSLVVLPNFHATWDTRVNYRISSPVSAFNISGLISSSPAAFPDFIPLIAVATFAAVKTSSSPKCIPLWVSRIDAFTGFKRSSKYFLHRERISFLSVKMLPAESLMVTWHSIFCPVNGGWSAKILRLPKNSWNPTEDQTLPMTSPWISLLPKLPLFTPQCTGIAIQMTICRVAR